MHAVCPACRQQLRDVVQRQKQQAGLERLMDSVTPTQRASLHSHPLPEEQSSSYDQLAGSTSASNSTLGAVTHEDAGCTDLGLGSGGVQQEQHGVDPQVSTVRLDERQEVALEPVMLVCY